MDTLTLKVPEIIKEKLNSFAKKKGLSRSEIIRNALLEYFSRDELDKEGTFVEFSKDLAGSIDGPSDLSVNKNYIDGYGKWLRK